MVLFLKTGMNVVASVIFVDENHTAPRVPSTLEAVIIPESVMLTFAVGKSARNARHGDVVAD